MDIKQYTMLKFKCRKCKEGQYYSSGEAIRCPYCDSVDGQVLTEVEGTDCFYYDCGSCGREFSWQDFEKNKYLCPHCNWDSLRISRDVMIRRRQHIGG